MDNPTRNPGAGENQPLGIFLVFFGGLIWSTAGLYTRMVSTDIPTTIVGRAVAGALVLFALSCAFSGFRNALRFTKGEIVLGALAGMSVILFISAFFYTSIANVIFIYGGMPLVTFILAMLVLGERADKISVAACVMCLAGTALIVGGAQRFGDFIGIALSIANCIVFALFTVAGKHFRDVNALRATLFATLFGMSAMLPFASFGEATSRDYVWLVMFGVLNIPLGTAVYLLGVQRVSALMSALVGMVEIPFASLWAWLAFNEEIGLTTFAGGVVILTAAAAYVINKSRHDSAPAPAH